MTNGLRLAIGSCLTCLPMRPPSRSLRSVLRLRTLAVALGVAVLAGLVIQPVGADQLSDKRAEAAKIAARLSELDAAMMTVNARFEEANYKLHQAEAAVAEARRMATITKAEMDKRAGELRSFAVKAYVGGAEGPAADSLLTEDASAGVISTTYMSSLSGNRQDYVDALNAAKAKAEEDAVRLAQAEAEAKASADEIEAARNQAKAQRDEQAALNAKVQGEVAELVRREQEAIRAAAAAAAAARRAATATAPSARVSSQVPVNVPPANGSVSNSAIRAGMTKIGSPYVWAASGPSSFDCSGFTQWAYGQAGISLPHYSGAQYRMTTRISASQLQPGDLVFWGGGGSAHVAIFIGNDQILHAFGEGVAITELDGWWMTPSGYGRLNL